MAGRQDYDEGIRKKELAYEKMGLDVIKFYPRLFAEDWESYIMNELEKTSIRRYRNLMAKPYWAKQANFAYGNHHPAQRAYSRNRFRCY